ncbi:hypothetical protein BGZ83_007185 [Gryganskiella cystojenkinii]|nr:hypothetical protein BGZ83_007185 [Gryganskiella cystojenkinii]
MSKSKELSAFLTWAEENEILWDNTAIEIKESKHGLGVFAKKSLEAGSHVVQVPKAIVLSVETTGIANLLEDEEIEGYIGLTMGCMYELARGSQSPWSAYLALLLKRPPQMATSLSEDKRQMMKLCEAYQDIEADIKDMKEDYDSIVVPFLEKNKDVFTDVIRSEFFSFEAFKTMTAIVSSRSMDVDNFHVSALVPFADFPMPNSDYLTHEDVCEICGALACEHMEDDGDDEDEEMMSEEDDDESPELVGADDDDEPPMLTENVTAESKKRTSLDKKLDSDDDQKMEEDEEWEDDEDDEDDDEEINDTCDITLDDDIKKGEEITRHYGPYPNKVLLSKYGFAVEDNPHDTVTIQLEMVRQTAEKILKDEKLVDERIQWFLETEDVFIGEEDDGDEEDGCCGDGDHEHHHEHGQSHNHHHSTDGDCCPPKKSEKGSSEKLEDEDALAEDSDDEDGQEGDFPRDIMYIMHDGSVDDRLLMLLNVLFMTKTQFEKVQADMDVAMEYFNDIFMRRQQEEHGDDEDTDMESEGEEDGDETPEKPELKPRDAESKKVRVAVLQAILSLVKIRADAFGVSDKTTAEQDLEQLKKAKMTGPLFYGGLCVQGEKQILQNALQGYTHFLSELRK